MKNMKIHIYAFFPAAIVLFILSVSSVYGQKVDKSQTNEPDQLQVAAFLKDIVDSDFEYQIDRSDPFVPFLKEKVERETTNMDEIVDVDETQLTGPMQQFEPGQLTLVAIVETSQELFAMAQDFTGKGYVITKGMKIGKRGVITDIIDNQVIIEETAFTRGGKQLTKEIIMHLKQEGVSK